MNKIVFLTFFGMLSQHFYAQELNVDLELRPRFEYRHGYKTLVPDATDAATFVSQRSRLNFNYSSEKLQAFIALQNVRVWGDVNTLSAIDINGTTLHAGWAKAILNQQFSIKVGRQEVIYDDQRIFGNVDWAQTGRSHDALILSYRPNTTNQFDIGLALNAETETLFDANYNVANYKSFQYIWYHTKLNKLSISALALNTGFAFDNNGDEQVDYNQTLGAYANYKSSMWTMEASAYAQTGKVNDRSLSAFNFSGVFHYQLNSNFNFGLGAEYLSGTDMNTTSSKLKSFNPLFGTNHKFNGWMDYFYVGNHANSVGLLDINGTVAYNNNRFSAKLVPHIFSSAATVVDGSNAKMNNALGTELDWVVAYQWTKDVTFNLGYSQMFATKTMEILKPGNKDNSNNWAWAMITVKPSLFKTAFKKAD
jgi:hypothetical protein